MTVVGFCDRCCSPARLLRTARGRVVVCDCDRALVAPRQFAVAMGSTVLREAVRIPLEATVPHHADNGERW